MPGVVRNPNPKIVVLRDRGLSAKEIAEEIGMQLRQVQRHLAAARNQGIVSREPVMDGFRVSKNTIRYDRNGDYAGEFVQQKPEIGPEFELPAGHVVKGISAHTDGQGRITNQWIKTKIDVRPVDLVAAIKSAFDDYQGRAEIIPPPAHTDSDLLAVYILTDVHHGMLAWGREAGEDYDLEISAQRILSSMRELIMRSPEASECLILNLGDYFHNNDQTNATPAHKHQLDVDGRFFKVVTTGVKLFQDCVELALQKHDNVRVKCLPGNHDPESSIILTVALSAFYANNPRVTVESEPGTIYYYRFGKTLIAASHGHTMKFDRLAMAMAVDCPKDWGDTFFRVAYTGHIHHETAKEVAGVRAESFNSPAAKDAHAANGGYRSTHSLSCVVHHREHGEVGRYRVNIVPHRVKSRVAA
jgi:DNA-binding transcriptional ArsR family regulator